MTFANGTTIMVTRHTASGTDAWGDPTFTTSSSWIDGCGVAPRSEPEVTAGGRQGVIIGVDLYLPAGSDLRADDLVTIGDVEYRVDGHPADWSSPHSGIARGMVVPLRRVEG